MIENQLAVTSTYTLAALEFTCPCGHAITMGRKAGAIAHGEICRCKEQYWVNWEIGKIQHGQIEVRV